MFYGILFWGRRGWRFAGGSWLGLWFGDGFPVLDVPPAFMSVGRCSRHGNAIFECSINRWEGERVLMMMYELRASRVATRWIRHVMSREFTQPNLEVCKRNWGDTNIFTITSHSRHDAETKKTLEIEVFSASPKRSTK